MSVSYFYHGRPLFSYAVLLKNPLRCIVQVDLMSMHVNRIYADGPERVDIVESMSLVYR